MFFFSSATKQRRFKKHTSGIYSRAIVIFLMYVLANLHALTSAKMREKTAIKLNNYLQVNKFLS